MDDIVDRLRSWADMFKGGHAQKLTRDAADEIERLRTAGDALAYWLRAETVNGAMAVCDGTNEAMNAWQEARRG